MHIADYSFQMMVNIACQNCASFRHLHVVSWKKPDMLFKDTHMYFLFSKSTDLKDQFTDEAMNWDLLVFEMFVCTTLIRLLPSSFLSYPAWSK